MFRQGKQVYMSDLSDLIDTYELRIVWVIDPVSSNYLKMLSLRPA